MNQDIKDYARTTGVFADISREATGIIDDLLRAIEWNLKCACGRLAVGHTPNATG